MLIIFQKSRSLHALIFFATSLIPEVSATGYTSLTDMSQYSDLPSDVQNYASGVFAGYYYPACSFTPRRSEITTAACFKATPSVASTLLHNVLKDPESFWDPDQPTEARTSVENLFTDWWNQAAVTALAARQDGSPTSSSPITSSTTIPSSSSSGSSKQSSTGQPGSSTTHGGWAGLSSVAQVFTILGPIIAIILFVLGLWLERRRRRNNRTRAHGEQQGMELDNQGHQAVNGRINGGIDDANAVIGNQNQTGNHTTNFGDHYYNMNDGALTRPAQTRIARKSVLSPQRTTRVEERSLGSNSRTTASTSRSQSERRTDQVRDV